MIVTPAILREAQDDGLCAAELARRIGVTRSAVSQAQTRHGIQLPRGRVGQRPNPHPERDAEIRRWRDAGEKLTTLASRFGLCRAHISRILAQTPAGGLRT